MDDTSPLETTCPACRAHARLLPIIYGPPREADWARARHGEVILAGTPPSSHAPTHECAACGAALTIELTLSERLRRAPDRLASWLAQPLRISPGGFWRHTLAAVPVGWVLNGLLLGVAIGSRSGLEDVRWANTVGAYGLGAIIGLALYLTLAWARLRWQEVFPIPESWAGRVWDWWLLLRLTLLAAVCQFPFILLIGAALE